MTTSRPSARVAFKVQGHDKTRLSIHRYGDDDRVPNPGDLLIVTTLGDANTGLTELAVLVPGREVGLFARESNASHLEYEATKDWLSQPVTRTRAGAA